MNSLLLICSSLFLGAQADVPAADTVVVCPPAYLEAMQPWFDHRAKQGHEIELITETESKEKIKAAIRKVAELGKLKFILLVGDVDTHSSPATSTTAVTEIGSGILSPAVVPTHIEEAVVNVHFGSEPQFATDNWYADLDGDKLPDYAIGRLSVKTADELKVVVQKILKYEINPQPGLWQRKINLVAGVGGFGRAADTMMESITKKFLTDEVPAHIQTTVAYGSWTSPYCPDPREFGDEAIRQLNEGSLFWIYIGHGQRQYLDFVRVPGAYYPIMTERDVTRLRCETMPPIAIFLSCYTGAFDEPHDCIAEQMLRQAGGPVACFSGSRVTMPYAMSVMGTEMLREYFDNQHETLGELLLHTKRAMVSSKDTTGNRKMLDMLARMVSPKPELLKEERLEHAQLFNLIGDPLLRLPRPLTTEVSTVKTELAGKQLEISITSPIAGKCHLELVCNRDQMTFKPELRKKYDSSEDSLAKYNQTYRRANDLRWSSKIIDLEQGTSTATLEIPDHCRGKCHVRIFIEGKTQCATGSCELIVRAQPES
ncbi:MAG: hypothetical protein COA78_19590 [Blastopirellula sp.]|nr:MAG: hypothetical protein COA78_19590 [Blastopirellula sp.]